MAQQPSMPVVWAAVQAALQAAVSSVTGLSASQCPVIWKWQTAPQPDVPYVALSLGAFIVEGFDYTLEACAPDWQPTTAYAVGDRVLNDTGPRTYTCITAGTSAGSGGPTGTGSDIIDGTVHWSYVAPGSEISITVGGVREVALQLEVWSAYVVEEQDKATALSICDATVTKLRLPTAQDALAAVGISPFDFGQSNWIPSIVAVAFRGRATNDVRCRVPARALVEYAGFVASITATANIGGGGAAIAEVIEAP